MGSTGDDATLRGTADVELTWIGHATVLLSTAGRRIVTDPLLTRRVAHLRRRALPIPRIDGIDTVLLSHVHLDHLHVPSLRKVSGGATAICPSGAGSLATHAGFADVVEVRAGERVDDRGATVTATPAVHRSGRLPFRGVTAEPVGYVIEIAGHRVYFAGDTDLFDDMADLGHIDVALLPIWGWGPTLGEGHLNPERAAEAVVRIGPSMVIPIHWGTYAPENGRRRDPAWFRRPIGAFEAALRSVGEADRLRVLDPGGTLLLPESPSRRPAPSVDSSLR